LPDPGIVYNSNDCKCLGTVVNTPEGVYVVVANQKADVQGCLEGKGYALLITNRMSVASNCFCVIYNKTLKKV